VRERVDTILDRHRVRRYLQVHIRREEHHSYRQTQPGRPGPETRYVRKTRKNWTIDWELDQALIDYDRTSDGMYPLLTNDRSLSDAQVFAAHKRQPTIEKRFHQTKVVLEIAPVFLKNEGRIEAFFFVYFLALLVQALIERDLRRTMETEGVEELPLYPEERTTRRPTAEQLFRLFSLTQHHLLLEDGHEVHVFHPELTELQRQVLKLLHVPTSMYRRRP